MIFKERALEHPNAWYDFRMMVSRVSSVCLRFELVTLIKVKVHPQC